VASISKRDNGKWRARYRDGADKEHARHFARKVDAQRWLDEVTASVVTGQYVDPRAGKMTVRKYAGQWQAAQVWRPKTAKRVESDLRLHILPVLGDRPISSVRPSDVQGLVKRWSGDLSPSSVRVVYATLRSLLKAATQDRVIAATPCVGVRLPSTGAAKVLTIPEVSTVRRIAETLPARWAAVAYVAAGLGLRPGEVFGLRVGDVDFLRRSVRVQQQLDDYGKIGPLKTDASYRTVPLPDVVGLVLSRHLEQHGGSGLVFAGPDGQPVRRNTFSKAWRRATTEADATGLRLHDLRHVYASALIHAGESVKTVQRRLGHSSAAMTLDVYSHLWPDSDERSRSAVDAYLSLDADSLRTAGASAQVSGLESDYLEKA
jgi:integrase